MQKTSGIVTAIALAGAISIAVFSPGAIAEDRGFGHRQGQMSKHASQMDRGGPGGYLNMICSENGAKRMEVMLGLLPERIELTAEQQALYDTFKAKALTAQTGFADNCTTPVRDADSTMIDHIKARQANMAAMVTAMDEVIPSFEDFYNSLTDAQKADLRPQDHGKFAGRHGEHHGEHRGMHYGMHNGMHNG